ncbi:putative disease resistance RPP13-like protein 1 [Hordeum vulgare]|uniref:WASH complex subunit 1 n=1 Tax=Hordeum vulgare subsp. vulgare TaxID=112509 RepID=UPI00162BECF3|nr:WASH complex subunit 1 [Hordeum vulgare subsp. vulgare]KAE8784943.1 putative disease resistance RPP13-like protein 1 [Hordeum vulgare]KAI5016459.1 hypothetical protein ZWY2020_006310 [Hordeum vulgare]
MRKQNKKKTYPSRIRSSGGQTTLQSFLFKPRAADGEPNPYPPPPPPPVAEDDEVPNSPPAPPKREIVRVTNKTIREKASAFSSVGSSARRGADASALDAAVFRRFNGSSPPAARAAAAEAGGDADDGGVRLDVEDIAAGSRRWESRKRKGPLGGNEGRASSNAGHVVVLGDDPKPRLPKATRTRGRIAGRGDGGRGLYNHYANGGGLWQGEQEGVDGEEVGWTEDMWEGMGSITLGGMEWH